jgi:hypothetical protein
MEDQLADRREVQAAQFSVLADISREMVRLYKEQFGRGPTKARTHWAGSDVLVCTLENTFTSAERKLIELGEHGRVRDIRTFFQYATVVSSATRSSAPPAAPSGAFSALSIPRWPASRWKPSSLTPRDTTARHEPSQT